MKLIATGLLLSILQITSADHTGNTLPKSDDDDDDDSFNSLPTPAAIRGSYSSGSPAFPASFDARDHWPRCASIGTVQDEGCCHASYTIAPTSVMSDRSCISSNGTRSVMFSAFHPLSCCSGCSKLPCSGGDPMEIWKYWISEGIATGCMPYRFGSACEVQGCPEECQTGRKVADTVVKGDSIYRVSPLDVQKEIYRHGPVQATIDLFEDFRNFTGLGIYEHSEGLHLGKQHVKLIGWGRDMDQNYWIAINSFGEKWGDRGSFKIVRGSDHLGVESSVIAGLPEF